MKVRNVLIDTERLVGGLALALLALGCSSVGPDHRPPTAVVSDAWRDDASPWLTPDAPDLAHWWRRFDDPLLDDLIEAALTRGPDLRSALARVRRARAAAGAAGAERFPSLDFEAFVVRRDESDNTPLGSFLPEFTTHSVGLGASWEPDLWGRVRRSIEAAEADHQASIEDARATAVLVAAETAAAYVDLRAFQNRLAIARASVALQEQTLALVRTRFDAGLVEERDVAQAATNVASTRSRVPTLEVGVRRAENRLAVLTGRAPGTLGDVLLEVRPIPTAPERVAIGVPADLLRRRPDVRRAERVLAAEVARIGVAEGDLYPRLTLAGVIGFAASDIDDFSGPSSLFHGWGPSLRWNLFDGGRLRSRVEAQDARAEEALGLWESTVLGALEEAENALTAFVREHVRRAALATAADEARRAGELARTQYREGLTDFQNVLDSERVQADLDDQLAASDAELIASLVAIYTSLGGGFDEGTALALGGSP